MLFPNATVIGSTLHHKNVARWHIRGIEKRVSASLDYYSLKKKGEESVETVERGYPGGHCG